MACPDCVSICPKTGARVTELDCLICNYSCQEDGTDEV